MISAPIDRIVWICQSPSPYNDHLFETLARDLSVPLDVYFRTRAGSSEDWNHGSSPRRWYRTFLRIDWSALAASCSSRSLFVTGCWQDLVSQLAIVYRIVTRQPYLIWNDTPDQRRQRPLHLRLARERFLAMAFRHAHAVLGTGKPALAAFREMGCPEDRLVNFPYFIDLEHFRPGAPAPDTPPGKPLTFGSCGRLDPIKGYDIALRALAAAYKGRFADFRYLLAGDGPERGNLATLARELGIADRVEFRGWLPYAEAPAFYRSLNVFLHPARFEPYGVAVLEAMACGLPAVASSETAAALDRLAPAAGMISLVGDIKALSAAIASFDAMAPDCRSRMGAAAREISEQWPAHRACSILSALMPETALIRTLDHGFDRGL